MVLVEVKAPGDEAGAGVARPMEECAAMKRGRKMSKHLASLAVLACLDREAMSVDMAATAAGERGAVERIEVPVKVLAAVVGHRELS